MAPRCTGIGSLKPLIVPSFFGDAFSIFLLRQFFLTIPKELSDAGRVDGATEFQLMWRVIVPLAKPAIVAVALFNFLYNWNDFFGPLLYLAQSPDPLHAVGRPLGVPRMHHVQWNLPMAASLLFMLHRDRAVLPRAEGLRRGRHADGDQGLGRRSHGVVRLWVDPAVPRARGAGARR